MNTPPVRECPNGHTVTDPTADYCATCGRPLMIRCSIGHLVDASYEFCDQCGAAVGLAEPEPGAPAAVTSRAPSRRRTADVAGPAERGRRARPWILIGGAVVVLIVGAVGLT